VDDEEVSREIEPCFVDRDGRRTDVVVLACTHFPLLLDRLQRLAPWPVDWLDPAEAIARRVADLLGPADGAEAAGIATAEFTSGEPPSEALNASLRRFGLEPAEL
jgi:glutamate racemase